MLPQSPIPVESRRPRRRSLTTAVGLLALVVLSAGAGPRVCAAPAPDKPTKKDTPNAPNPPQTPPAPDARHVWRLGARVQPPGATLADQLDLPRGQGLVLETVPPGSAAGKAGLKAHDILLELNGKPVPNRPHELERLLKDVKGTKAVEALVLRKGKKERIKGLTLPEANARPGLPLGPGAGSVTKKATFSRTSDKFTASYQEGPLTVTLTGTVQGGKAKVQEILVRNGAASHKYESVNKVPERYQAKVKDFIDSAEKNRVHVEAHSP